MSKPTVGILHPGAMGVTIAANAAAVSRVVWASAGRREQSRQRAAAAGLEDVGSVAALCAAGELIISVCPPHAAEDVATEVIGCGFKGTYLDANAIAPERALRIAAHMERAGIDFVDGGIVGGPAVRPGTVLYLSGPSAGAIPRYLGSGPLEVRVIGTEPGRASALKLCYAAWSKGSTALLTAILSAAEALGVRNELYRQWTEDGAVSVEHAEDRARTATAKAWRYAGEMREISAMFGGAGVPEGFHAAAAELYERLAEFKDAPEKPAVERVIAAVLGR